MSAPAPSSVIVLAVLVSVMSLGDLQGQEVAPGTKLRWKDDRRWIYAEASDSGRARITAHRRPQPIPWDNPSLEYQVRPSRKEHAAGIGMAVGFITGATLGYSLGDDTCRGWMCFRLSREAKAGLFGFMFARIGLLIGALSAEGAEWAPLTGQGSARFRLHLDQRMLGLRATF